MPVTVLYAENIFGDDTVERRIYGTVVRVILAAPNRSLADIPDEDCAPADGLMMVTTVSTRRTSPGSPNCARPAVRASATTRSTARRRPAGRCWC